MKFRVPEIALGALLAVAVFAMGFIFASSFRPINDTEYKKAEAATASKSVKHGFWEKTSEDPVAYFTLWLVGFTGVLAISTIGLWAVTWRVGSRQSKETKILQRAYISVDGDGVSPLAADTLKRSIAHIIVKNVGNLPAGEVKWFIDTIVSNNGKLSHFPINEKMFFGKNTVSPGTDMRRSQYFAVNDSEYEGIMRGRSFLYVWGEVRYLDGFGKQRFTRFCHRYDKRGYRESEDTSTAGRPLLPRIIVELTSESMRYHQYGNDAD